MEIDGIYARTTIYKYNEGAILVAQFSLCTHHLSVPTHTILIYIPNVNNDRRNAHLFLLGTTTAGLLGSSNGLLILCWSSTTLKTAHQSSGSLERTLQITDSFLAEQVDLDLVTLEYALERDDGLDQEWVGVLEVQVHDAHHSNAHELRLVESLHLVDIVLVVGGCDELGLFGGSHLWLLDIFKGGHVCRKPIVSIAHLWGGL